MDNGFRPAGLFDMSATTLSVSLKIRDYGATYGAGTVARWTRRARKEEGA